MAYTIHFTDQSIEGVSGDPFFTKAFSLPDGRFIELKNSTSQEQGQGQLIITPVTGVPNPFLLAGRGSENWGEVINENILKLVEQSASFEASSGVPSAIVNNTAIRGQSWYNLTDEHIYVFDGVLWIKQSRSDDSVTFATSAGDANTLNGLPSTSFVLKSGDTMSGFLTLNADPTSLTHAATKRYVDDQIVASLTGTASSVFGRTGNVVALSGDYNANQITFAPVGNIVALNVQDAIEELDNDISNIPAAANYFNNSSFNFWQRGAGPFVYATGQFLYTADRWLATSGDATSFAGQVTQEFHQVGDGVENAALHYLKWAVTINSGGVSAPSLVQRIENSLLLHGREVTLSFWGRSATSNNVDVKASQVFNNSPTILATSPTFAFTPTWTKFSHTFMLPDATGKSVAAFNNHYIQFSWAIGNNTIGEVRISQVQLEPGATASKFFFKSQQTDLADCQRFFSKSYGTDVAPGTPTFVGIVDFEEESVGNILHNATAEFPVTMRAVPTIQVFSTTGAINQVNAASGGAGTDLATAAVGASQDRVGRITLAAASPFNGLVEEYRFAFTADAEL